MPVMSQKPVESKPTHLNLGDLLKWWSILEPDRCQYSEDQDFEEPWYTVIFETGKAHIEFKRATQEDHALLQAAVQKAIEAKGWMWSVLHSSRGIYRAGVKIAERYVSETARFPAYALLASYCRALDLSKRSKARAKRSLPDGKS